ncbi:M48 family metalloprotease [Nonomuraea endophytica]|uniref:M48 family metalloprotease n=1 Tax=Nonomuraea endophytica TaxID=714136 RepID=UPI0037CA5C5C
MYLRPSLTAADTVLSDFLTSRYPSGSTFTAADLRPVLQSTGYDHIWLGHRLAERCERGQLEREAGRYWVIEHDPERVVFIDGEPYSLSDFAPDRDFDPVEAVDPVPAPSSPVSGPDVEPNTRPGLIGAVEHLQAAGRAATLPVLVTQEDDGSAVINRGRCGISPILTIGAGALAHERAPALVATLAHEMAHIELRHDTERLAVRWPGVLSSVLCVLGSIGIMAALLSAGWPGAAWQAVGWTAAAAGVLGLALKPLDAWLRRIECYDADLYAAELIDLQDLALQGLDGHGMIEALLRAQPYGPDGHYDGTHEAIGWLLSGDPSATRRLTHLRRGERVRRLVWDRLLPRLARPATWNTALDQG